MSAWRPIHLFLYLFFQILYFLFFYSISSFYSLFNLTVPFTWPNDGTKWPDSNEAMVYDSWFESLDKVRQQIEYEELEIKWPSSHTKNPNKNEKNNHEETGFTE